MRAGAHADPSVGHHKVAVAAAVAVAIAAARFPEGGAMSDTAGSPINSRDGPMPDGAEDGQGRAASVVERLFETHADRLRRYVYRYVRSWETAQDLVSDVFLRLWDRRHALDSVDDVEGYLYTCARNTALSHLRQRRVEE